MYAIIDIETTGGSPVHEKITEIAIYIHDGEKIIDEFTTLVNPERLIPAFITQMTGISNEMVAGAPRFFEIAKKIVDITSDKIFVAHNATFDYNFIKNEFRSLGYEFKREILCTVKTSRKLLPGKKSYSLGNLCNELNLEIHNRHRAAGDALATVKLFEILLNADSSKKDKYIQDKFALKGLHPNLTKEQIKSLPDDAGVYYFYNDNQDLIYIGKSNNIQNRVLSHLRNEKSPRAMEMKEKIADIHVERTGSELVALLLESDEIKKHKPLYNKAQRRNMYNTGLYSYMDRRGYVQLIIDDNKKEHSPLISFTSKTEARRYLHKIVEEYELCQKLCGIYKTDGACFQHGLGLCKGACVNIEKPEEYNSRISKLIKKFEFDSNNFLIIDMGRTNNEKSVIKVENGKYIGFGFFEEEYISGITEISECVKQYADTRDAQQIIRTYTRTKKIEKIIYLDREIRS